MESNRNLKEINIKIKNRTCYYLDDIIEFNDFDFNNIIFYFKIHTKIF